MRDSVVKPYEGNEKYIFVSYCHRDNDRAMDVIRMLSEGGYRVWYDEGIDPGSDWPEVIANHLNNAHACVALITENALNSHNCRREINFALRRSIPLLSIFLEPVKLSLGMEMQIYSSQVVFRYELPDDDAFMEKISEARCLEETNAAWSEDEMLMSVAGAGSAGEAVLRRPLIDVLSTESGFSSASTAFARSVQIDEAAKTDRAGSRSGRKILLIACAVAALIAVAALSIALISSRTLSAGGQHDSGSRLFAANNSADPDRDIDPVKAGEATPEAPYEPTAEPTDEPTAEPTQEPKMVSVPDVTGMDRNIAVNVIKALGLEPAIVDYVVCSNRDQDDSIMSQLPESGQTIEEGGRVELTVSGYLEPAFSSTPGYNGERVEYNGHEYMIVLGWSSWSEAEAFCESMGGHLATITDVGEELFIQKLNCHEKSLWIGGHQTGVNKWEWVTGEAWEFEYWGEGEPNGEDEICAAVWPVFWNDLRDGSAEQEGFICEWE